MARVKARILSDTVVDGAGYKVNQVVAFESEQAKQLATSGAIDTSPAAVKYCEDELEAEAVDHAPKAPAAAKPKKK